MSHFPLLSFFVVILFFIATSLYLFVRLAAIRVSGDAASTMMVLYIAGATLIIASTLLFLVQS